MRGSSHEKAFSDFTAQNIIVSSRKYVISPFTFILYILCAYSALTPARR